MKKRTIFWIALVALMALHHDWWFWIDPQLVFGFMPIGLAYHIFISIAAGCLWAWAAYYALPEFVKEEIAPERENQS